MSQKQSQFNIVNFNISKSNLAFQRHKRTPKNPKIPISLQSLLFHSEQKRKHKTSSKQSHYNYSFDNLYQRTLSTHNFPMCSKQLRFS